MSEKELVIGFSDSSDVFVSLKFDGLYKLAHGGILLPAGTTCYVYTQRIVNKERFEQMLSPEQEKADAN